MEENKPAIRNAYQKVRPGDTVGFITWKDGVGRTACFASVTGKGRFGAISIRVVEGQPDGILYSSDIVTITRNGLSIF